MSVAAIVAAWDDRGRILDRNRARNQGIMREFGLKQRQARAENEKRAAEYRATITLNPEVR
jgi:hypothetical protein